MITKVFSIMMILNLRLKYSFVLFILNGCGKSEKQVEELWGCCDSENLCVQPTKQLTCESGFTIKKVSLPKSPDPAPPTEL